MQRYRAYSLTVRKTGTIACHKSVIEGNIRMAHAIPRTPREPTVGYKMSLGLANQSLFGSLRPTVSSRKYARMASPNC